MQHNEHASNDAVRQHLDVRPGTLTAGRAARRVRQTLFDLVLDLGDLAAGQKEGREQREENAPRVYGVRNGRQHRGADAQRRQRFAAVGAVDEGQRRGNGDCRLHGARFAEGWWWRGSSSKSCGHGIEFGA